MARICPGGEHHQPTHAYGEWVDRRRGEHGPVAVIHDYWLCVFFLTHHSSCYRQVDKTACAGGPSSGRRRDGDRKIP